MSEIFISYASTDRQRIQPIINILEKKGWSVWWDRKIPPGRSFDDVIEEALDISECVIVIWSKESVRSKWVRTEAGEGERRGILIPIQIDDVVLPLAFRRIEAVQLVGWDGVSDHPELENLFEAISRFIKPSVTTDKSSETSETQMEKKDQLPEVVQPPVFDEESSNESEMQVEENDQSVEARQQNIFAELEPGTITVENADVQYDIVSLIKKLWVPILLISILLAIINVGMSQLKLPPQIGYPISGFLTGISIGFFLMIVLPKLQWKNILFYSGLWAVSGLLSALPFSLTNSSPTPSNIIISRIISMLIGGIIIGLLLRKAEPGIKLNRLFIGAISWIIVTFIGSFLSNFVYITIYFPNENLALANFVNSFIWGVLYGVAIVWIVFIVKK